LPFTPFHIGPHTLVALPLEKYIDLPVFILANVVVDIEPLFVMMFNPDYPLHGYCHTFLIGGVIGALWGATAYLFRNHIGKFMASQRLPYSTSLVKMLFSGLLGVWLHVLFDAMLYSEMKPFYPFAGNPFLGLISLPIVYAICAVCFIPAGIMYFKMAKHTG
jgi:membrane-bound metal-dependent hydrolase YbcI (DUF457 family)